MTFSLSSASAGVASARAAAEARRNRRVSMGVSFQASRWARGQKRAARLPVGPKQSEARVKHSGREDDRRAGGQARVVGGEQPTEEETAAMAAATASIRRWNWPRTARAAGRIMIPTAISVPAPGTRRQGSGRQAEEQEMHRPTPPADGGQKARIGAFQDQRAETKASAISVKVVISRKASVSAASSSARRSRRGHASDRRSSPERDRSTPKASEIR